jgi:asparagine N-glycosylation enzyme membrane subunit Stt3
MEIFIEYLEPALWVLPPVFFLMSFLHYKKKVKPSSRVGYSAKGQFFLGVASIFCASALTLALEGYYVVFMSIHFIIFFYSVSLELNAKSKLVSKLENGL